MGGEGKMMGDVRICEFCEAKIIIGFNIISEVRSYGMFEKIVNG